MLTDTQKNELKTNGYLKLNSVVDKNILLSAQKYFNRWRHELLSGNRKLNAFESVGICHNCQAFKNADFMNSARDIAFSYARSLLGENNVVEFGSHLMGWPPAHEQSNERQQWHIDGVKITLDSKTLGNFPRFQLTIGLPITNIENTTSGGLVVWPQQHNYIADIFKEVRNIKFSLEKIHKEMQMSYPPGECTHLYEKSGDIIIFNSLLPHGTAINKSSNFADKIYFRFCHAEPAMRVGLYPCRNPWGKWRSMN